MSNATAGSATAAVTLGSVLAAGATYVLFGTEGQRAAYVALEFSDRDCVADLLDATLRYQPQRGETADWSRRFDLAMGRDIERVEVFALVFRPERFQSFSGIQLSADTAPCFRGLSRVVETERLPVLPELLLVDGGTQPVTPYQTFKDLESRNDLFDAHPAVVTDGPRPPTAQRLSEADVRTLTWSTSHDPHVRLAERSWQVDVKPRTPTAYLASTQPVELRAGDRVVVDLELEAGPIGVGLQRDAQWSTVVSVMADGDANVILTAPADGTYELYVTANVSDDDAVSVRVRSAAVVPNTPPAGNGSSSPQPALPAASPSSNP